MTSLCIDRDANILIIDYVGDSSSTLLNILNERGYRIFQAHHNSDAIQVVDRSNIQLIILEIKTPNSETYKLCSQLRSSAQTCHIPILFISEVDDPKNKIIAFNMGGTDFIAKPFQNAEILARVENHIAIARQHQNLQRQTQELMEKNAQLKREMQQHQQTQSELEKVHETLECLVTLDGLTGIANRRQFDCYLTQELRRCSREGQPLSLLLCDIDYFKTYNDACGHLAGDRCLRSVAQALSNALKRAGDLAARYGGEEFAIVLPNTDAAGGLHIARTIQRRIEELQIPHPRSKVSDRITISLGGISWLPTADIRSSMVIALADKQLYQAKQYGRNCYCLDVVPSMEPPLEQLL